MSDEHKMRQEGERTPIQTLYGVRRVNDQLGRIEAHAQAAANNSLLAIAKVDAMDVKWEARFGKLDSRVSAVERTRVWLPYALAFLNACLSAWLYSLIRR